MPSRAEMRRSGALVATTCVLAATLALSACREATSPTEGLGVPGQSAQLPKRLTFSLSDDRSPSWSLGGDSVYYTAPGSAPFAESKGLLLRIPALGGQAEPMLPDVQQPTAPERWLTNPEVTSAAGRIAYAEMWSISDGNICPGAGAVQCTPGGADPEAPFLREIILRVRDVGSTTTIDQDPSLRVPFQGVDLVPGPLINLSIEFHPFHHLFNEEGSFVFKPDWSPDGQRLVFSDGLRLLIWDPGSQEAAPIPGTEDGVQPSWSRDGEWIAYTRLERGTPLNASCTHFTALGPACTQTRTVWPVARRMITVTRPDGSESFEVTVGEQPAWTSFGDRLVFKRGGNLALVSVDGSGLSDIPNTEGGAEPAVSPEGLRLAFSRVGENGSFDIWVTQLDQELP